MGTPRNHTRMTRGWRSSSLYDYYYGQKDESKCQRRRVFLGEKKKRSEGIPVD
jgi:hypothetical protein